MFEFLRRRRQERQDRKPVNHHYRPAYKPLYEAALRELAASAAEIEVARRRLLFYQINAPELTGVLHKLEVEGQAVPTESAMADLAVEG